MTTRFPRLSSKPWKSLVYAVLAFAALGTPDLFAAQTRFTSTDSIVTVEVPQSWSTLTWAAGSDGPGAPRLPVPEEKARPTGSSRQRPGRGGDCPRPGRFSVFSGRNSYRVPAGRISTLRFWRRPSSVVLSATG